MIPLVIFLTLFIGLATNSVDSLGVPSSLSVIPLPGHGDGAAVCAIVFQNSTKIIECSIISDGVGVSEPFPVYSNVSFASITGGSDSLCGLQSGGTAFYCWRATGSSNDSTGTIFVPRRVYKNETVPLRALFLGGSYVAAADESDTFIHWWGASRDFPREVSGNFSSLTSGADFTCAINSRDDFIECWGPRGPQIKAAFAKQRMSTIVAGDLCACGVTKNGRLLCSANGFGQPAFELRSLDLGSSDACVLRSNGTVACWRAGGEEYYPAKGSSFIFFVAGGGLFCGLTKDGYKVNCWWTNQSPSQTVKPPLPSAIPGICSEKSSCLYGRDWGTEMYCAADEPCLYLSRPSRWSSERIQWLVIGCFFFFGSVLGIWANWRICKEVQSSCLASRAVISCYLYFLPSRPTT